MGVAVRKGKTLSFVLQTPRPYLARQKGKDESQLWCRHLHFVEVNTDNQVDMRNQNVLYTLGVFPCSLMHKYKKVYSCTPLFDTNETLCAQKQSMFVNLEQYLEGKRSGCIGVNAIADPAHPPIADDDLVLNWNDDITTLQKQLQSNQLVQNHGEHTPFIVYCAHEECVAAQELIHKLYELGYCNVYYMKHGMREAQQKLLRLKTFLDNENIY